MSLGPRAAGLTGMLTMLDSLLCCRALVSVCVGFDPTGSYLPEKGGVD